MKKARKKNPRNEESGMVLLETLPLLIVFIVLFGYALGCFGAIHTGILNSIAARNYAFEIFRHRSNLVYLRSNGDVSSNRIYYNNVRNRIHGIMSEKFDRDVEGNVFPATERKIAMGLDTDPQQRTNETEHNTNIPGIAVNEAVPTATQFQANPIWIKSQYGICLNSKCMQ